MALAADDPDAQVRVAAFAQGLQELGWTVGENVRIDYRWAASEADRIRYAAELVALMPDVVLATSGATVGALQQASQTVPIVFVTTIDPVGGGWVASLARPGGNATGFMNAEFSASAKLLEMLKQIAPRVTRAAVLRVAAAGGIGQFAAIQTAAASLGVELTPIDTRDNGEIERALTAFARAANGGLIMTIFGPGPAQRNLIIALAAVTVCPRFIPPATSSPMAA